MKKWVAILLGTEEKRSILKNILSLSTIQMFSQVLPLLTIPYVLRIVGTEKYGVAALSLAIVGFFNVIVDYGFNLSATKEASIYRNDKRYLSHLFSTVMSVKFFLCVVSWGIYFVLTVWIPDLYRYQKVYLWSYTIVVGQMFFPTWFFQGIEKMGVITVLNIIGRLLFTASVFLVIQSPQDLHWVVGLQGASGILMGFIALGIALRIEKLTFFRPKLHDVFKQLKGGWSIFISNFGVNTYINSNIVVLGAFGGSVAVGFYSVAEKLILAVRGLAVILFQAIYPRACLRVKEKRSLRSFYQKVFIPVGALFFLMGFLFWFLNQWIVQLLAGVATPRSAAVLAVLAFVPMIVVLNIPAYQSLMILGKQKAFSSVLLLGAVFNISANIYCSKHWHEQGTAWVVLMTEILITVSLYGALAWVHRRQQNEFGYISKE